MVLSHCLFCGRVTWSLGVGRESLGCGCSGPGPGACWLVFSIKCQESCSFLGLSFCSGDKRVTLSGARLSARRPQRKNEGL